MTAQQLIKTKTFLSTTAAIFLFVIAGFLFSNTLSLLATSMLLAMIFNPIVDFLERLKIRRVFAVMIVFVMTALLLFSVSSILLPRLISQLNQIASSLTEEKINNAIGQIDLSLKSKYPFLSTLNLSQKISSVINTSILASVSNLTEIIYNLFSFITVLVIVPFITFFLLKDQKKLMHGIISMMPNKYFEFSFNVLAKISKQLSRFVRGWIFDASIVGVLAGCGLALLGIDNAVSIGFIAGIGHLIPYFGPVIGGLPAIIISVFQFGDLSMLPSVIVLFLVIYTIDNGIIQPNIFAKSTDMHPMVIIVLILIGSETLGLLGMLFAVPIATVIKTSIKEIYVGFKNYKILNT